MSALGCSSEGLREDCSFVPAGLLASTSIRSLFDCPLGIEANNADYFLQFLPVAFLHHPGGEGALPELTLGKSSFWQKIHFSLKTSQLLPPLTSALTVEF